MQKYSKKLLLSNIDYLIKKKGIKVGELEAAARVSSGYFSRLKNNENETVCPAVDTLSLIADKFNISLINLLYSDMTSLTEDDLYVIKFLKELTERTQDDKIKWDAESVIHFYDPRNYYIRDYHHPLHLLDYDDNNEKIINYKSLFNEKPVELAGPIYKLFRIKRNMYITKIQSCDSNKQSDSDKSEGYEFYFEEKDETSNSLHKVCYAIDNKGKPEIYDMLKTLYEAITITSNNTKLDQSVKDGIAEFFDDNDVDIPDEDLPF